MSLISELAATNDVAMTVAGAIERALGDDVILAVGLPREEAPTSDVLPVGALRAVRIAVNGPVEASLTLFVGDLLAGRLEASAPDELLVTAVGDALTGGAADVARATGDGAAAGPVEEVAADNVLSQPRDGEYLAYPLLEGTDRVACIVVHVGDPAPAEEGSELDLSDPGAGTAVALHEYQPLDGAGTGLVDPRPLALLADVEMGVTAELGRRRMAVRDLLSLTPGAVIELDRAAGSPVDVLVNGTLIARGEVVVIDEEFGIRISELVAGEPSPH